MSSPPTLSTLSPPSDLESGCDSEDSRSLSTLTSEIASLLSQMSSVSRGMEALAAKEGVGGQHKLIVKRFKEIHVDFTQDYDRRRSALEEKRRRHELLSSSSGGRGGEGDESDTAQLLRERTALNSSLSSSRSIISQASEIFTSLQSQRGNLGRSKDRAAGIGGNIPGINRIVDGIRRRRQRDNMVLGAVIAGCVLFTMWYWVG